METYILDLGERKVEILLEKTKIFCRYCSILNQECLKKHRSAIVWYVEINDDNSTKYYIVSDGEIPPEFYVASYIYHIDITYETRGFWTVPKAIKEVSKEEFEDTIDKIDLEPSNYDLHCLVHRLLGKHKRIEAPVSTQKLPILTILADLEIKPSDITKIELTWLKNVYSRWLDDSKEYRDADNIVIERIPKSFTEKLIFPEFDEFLYSKKRSVVIEKSEENGVLIYRAFRKENDKRYLIAIYVKYSETKKALFWFDGMWRGKEIYFKHKHPECTLDPLAIDLLYEMIHRRLGDLLFLDDYYIYKMHKDSSLSDDYNVDFKYILTPATKDHLKKITVINARIEEVEEHNNTLLKIIPENNELSIQIIHPEHGCLELPPTQSYYIYQVPYLRAGHD